MTQRTVQGLPLAALALALMLLMAPQRVLANIRAPKVVPRAPSTAAFSVDPALNLVVLDEALTFTCHPAACSVEARYRIRAPVAVTVELSFVMPLAAPLRVTVGSNVATGRVTAAAPELLREQDLDPWERDYDLVKIPTYQASFVAPLAMGDNTVSVAYQQPLGQYERSHGYFSGSRFTDFFRYELWPLSEWRHAPGFHVQGEVIIDRPSPSWWKRTFSQPRAVRCWARGGSPRGSLAQAGDLLHYRFRIEDPLPKRIWCHIGDEDLLPK